MKRAINVQIRVTADSQEESDAAREWLLAALSGLSLARGRPGRNPKYADAPKVLAYGDLDINLVAVKQPARRRRAPKPPPVDVDNLFTGVSSKAPKGGRK